MTKQYVNESKEQPPENWLVEGQSIGKSIESDGSSEPPPAAIESWPVEGEPSPEAPEPETVQSGEPWKVTGESSENLLDTPPATVDDGPKCVGEFRVLLFEDETVNVIFEKLGRWTPGRIEKAMSRIFRENIIQRQKELRKSLGQPEDFAIHGEE